MATKKTKETEKMEEVQKNPTYYYAVGRHREATARIRLYILANETSVSVNGHAYQKGQIVINERPVENYFPGELAKKLYLEPFRTTNALTRFVTTAKIEGGGLQGQLVAFIHSAARALVKVDPEKNRPILKKRGFLTRDPRTKQRRKAGYAGKARKKKQSPKR